MEATSYRMHRFEVNNLSGRKLTVDVRHYNVHTFMNLDDGREAHMKKRMYLQVNDIGIWMSWGSEWRCCTLKMCTYQWKGKVPYLVLARANSLSSYSVIMLAEPTFFSCVCRWRLNDRGFPTHLAFLGRWWEEFHVRFWMPDAFSVHENKISYTSRPRKLSISSIWITWPILGRLCASGSTQQRATRRILFSSFGDGFSGTLGSTTCSDLLSLTMVFNQSIKLNCEGQSNKCIQLHC